MKSVLSFKGYLILLLLGIVLYNCSKHQDPTPSTGTTTPTTPDPDPAPAVLTTPLIDSIAPTDNQTVDIYSSLKIKFHQSVNRPITLNDTKKDVRYRPVVDNISIDGVNGILIWNKDSTRVTINHKEVLTPNSAFIIKVSAHWEQYKDGKWIIVNWNNADLKESKQSSFKSGSAVLTIEESNVDYVYPIPNQYHFLSQESATGFLKFKEGLPYLFNDTNYETWVEFNTPSSQSTSPITYDADKDRINFSIPTGLQNETIYNVVMKRKNKTTSDETTLYQYAVRTSKYNTFADKIAAVITNQTALRAISGFSTSHQLLQDFTAGEYFDDFELETQDDILATSGTPYTVKHSSNLIQFNAIMSGNDWFDNTINPILYAPWTDPSYTPVLSRDTSAVGYKPARAMYIQGAGGELTADMITQNTAPALASGTYPRVIYNLDPYYASDYGDISKQMLTKYGTNPPTRESTFIWQQYPLIKQGTYKYKMRYHLPDGTITSSIDMSMYNPIQ